MRSALVKRWPSCKVHLFGSTANQLSICNNNDIDVCLELPDLPTDAVRHLPHHRGIFWSADNLSIPKPAGNVCD